MSQPKHTQCGHCEFSESAGFLLPDLSSLREQRSSFSEVLCKDERRP